MDGMAEARATADLTRVLAGMASALAFDELSAPVRELGTALEAYLRDEFLDAQREALADYAHFWGDGDA